MIVIATVAAATQSRTEAAIRAINEVELHRYLVKPWDPPEEKLWFILDKIIAPGQP